MFFRIAIDPIPCPRPRIAMRGRVPVAYYPKDYAQWKEQAAEIVRSLSLAAAPIDVPVAVTINVFAERPRTTKLPAPKPDVDNYAKSVMDALTSAGLWTDDSLVQSLHVTKAWAKSPAYVGIAVYIENVP